MKGVIACSVIFFVGCMALDGGVSAKLVLGVVALLTYAVGDQRL